MKINFNWCQKKKRCSPQSCLNFPKWSTLSYPFAKVSPRQALVIFFFRSTICVPVEKSIFLAKSRHPFSCKAFFMSRCLLCRTSPTVVAIPNSSSCVSQHHTILVNDKNVPKDLFIYGFQSKNWWIDLRNQQKHLPPTHSTLSDCYGLRILWFEKSFVDCCIPCMEDSETGVLHCTYEYFSKILCDGNNWNV